MPVLRKAFTVRPRVMTMIVASMLPTSASAAAGLRFERVFAAAGEPSFLRYRVRYLSRGKVHGLEVWRDRDRRVKRITDGTIASFASHRPGDAEYQLTVLDMKRRISTRIDRTNMYRMGDFTDWFDLGHGLRHPQGPYRLVAGKPPMGLPRPARPCRWYDLTSGGRTTNICWDPVNRLPLLIAADDRRPIWRVLSLDRRAIPTSAFALHDQGYIHNDADRDMEQD